MSIFPNFTNDHSFYTDGLWGFIFSGVVRIVKKSIFCFWYFQNLATRWRCALCLLFHFSSFCRCSASFCQLFSFWDEKSTLEEHILRKLGGQYFLFTNKRGFCKQTKTSYVFSAPEALFIIPEKTFLVKIIEEHSKLSFETNYIDLWWFWGVLGARNGSKADQNWAKFFQIL